MPALLVSVVLVAASVGVGVGVGVAPASASLLSAEESIAVQPSTDRVGNVSTPVAVSILTTSAPGPQPGDGSTPEAGPPPASGTAADPISPSDASAPLQAPTRAAALAATGGDVDGILLGAGGLLLVAGILSLAIPRRRVQ
ncbi:hypothetical protein [Microbacterium phyllosphaerae]|uniref:hypothetical protein n=1 Tax=Microbacterium phyllosphaerae TaxID=124798 RepID=UPI000EA37825|nr:hypothetical protein [Microbacterium phyllosphaerae]